MKETVTVFEQQTPYPKFNHFKDARNHYVDLYWKLHRDTWDKNVYFPFKGTHVWDKISDVIDEIITKNHCFVLMIPIKVYMLKLMMMKQKKIYLTIQKR